MALDKGPPTDTLSSVSAAEQALLAAVRLLEEAARGAGLTLAQARLLLFLSRHKEATAGEIARTLGITSGPVTSLTARLLRRRLVRRRPDPADLRSVLFALTQEGEAAVSSLRAALARALVDVNWAGVPA